MARPNKGRGRKAMRLPPLAVTDDEYAWFCNEIHRLNAIGHDMNATRLMRDRIFAEMPGYVPHLLDRFAKGNG